jgi:hypothetical protein
VPHVVVIPHLGPDGSCLSPPSEQPYPPLCASSRPPPPPPPACCVHPWSSFDLATILRYLTSTLKSGDPLGVLMLRYIFHLTAAIDTVSFVLSLRGLGWLTQSVSIDVAIRDCILGPGESMSSGQGVSCVRQCYWWLYGQRVPAPSNLDAEVHIPPPCCH